MLRRIAALVALLPIFALGQTPDPLLEQAQKLAHENIIVDTHIDVPYRLIENYEDVSKRTQKGDFDAERAKLGGLNAPFMSIYVPSNREDNGAVGLADTLIMSVEKLVKDHPEVFALARSSKDVRANTAKGLISLPMGMENGAPIDHKLENIKRYFDKGIRYITLAHAKSNHISNAAYDTVRPWKGLSPFGDEVVKEMNRVGIMVDVSHLTDDAIARVLQLSKAPVIASHSSCRYFTPGFERNISDEMILGVAKGGGVVMIAFGSSFLTSEYKSYETNARKEISAVIASKGWKYGQPEAQAYIQEYQQQHPAPYATVTTVADHIEHVIKLAGVDHVGFGSDFDGVGDELPIGLKSVADYPNLIRELLARGYSAGDIRKICGENILRVWSDVEKISAK